jgi:putative transposase
VRVAEKWNYICLLIDLFNREIIGHNCGSAKDANLVYRAFAKFKGKLNNIQLFHTERGKEFKNQLLDEVIKTFKIKQSLSMKGCPYDNAAAEATYKLVKSEFIRIRRFDTLEQFKRELDDYVLCFNYNGFIQYKFLNKTV